VTVPGRPTGLGRVRAVARRYAFFVVVVVLVVVVLNLLPALGSGKGRGGGNGPPVVRLAPGPAQRPARPVA